MIHSRSITSVDFFSLVITGSSCGDDVASLKRFQETEKLERFRIGNCRLGLTKVLANLHCEQESWYHLSHLLRHYKVWYSSLYFRLLDPPSGRHWCFPFRKLLLQVIPITSGSRQRTTEQISREWKVKIGTASKFWNCLASFDPLAFTMHWMYSALNFALDTSKIGRSKWTILNGSGPGNGDPAALASLLSNNERAYAHMFFHGFRVQYLDLFSPFTGYSEMCGSVCSPLRGCWQVEAFEIFPSAHWEEWVSPATLHCVYLIAVSASYCPTSCGAVGKNFIQCCVLPRAVWYSWPAPELQLWAMWSPCDAYGSILWFRQKRDRAKDMKLISMENIIHPYSHPDDPKASATGDHSTSIAPSPSQHLGHSTTTSTTITTTTPTPEEAPFKIP